MNETSNDFVNLNSQLVAEWPEWKRQYDLRVSSYGPEISSSEASATVRVEVADAAPAEEKC